ncbi:MAG: MarR family transcriptional regulator [Chloroflexi bacterium]|nr:MAG: MarR family transcriptional regulator [Chloroflexota bacterium]
MISNEQLARRILELIPLAMRAVHARMRRMTESGFVPPHYRVLALLYREPRGMSDLARCQAVSLPTMSRTVSALVERGLLARSRDPKDRRRVLLSLTDEGRALFLRVHAEIEERLARRIATLSAEEREQLAAGLEVLHRLFATDFPQEALQDKGCRERQAGA